MVDTRQRMIQIGAEMLRRRGYHATTLVDVVKAGGLPRGSIYHHFPEGKPQLAQEAIAYAATEVGKDMVEVAATADSAADAIEAYVRLLADRLEQSGYVDGCWYAGTALDTVGTVPAVAETLADEFQRWQTTIRDSFLAWGVASKRADDCAALVIAAVEGGLLRARLARNVDHLLRLIPLLREAVDVRDPVR